MDKPSNTVIISLGAYKYSTRARKAAVVLNERGARVTFLGLSRAGRTGQWDDPGVTVVDGITIKQVEMQAPRTAPRRVNQFLNLVVSYTPAFCRLALDLCRSRYDAALVVSTPLIPLGILFKILGGRVLAVDVTERPGAVSSKGSVFEIFRAFEKPLLRIVSRKADIVTAVVPPDVAYLKSVGFDPVKLVRNAPLDSWRAPDRALPLGVVKFCLVGSLFEGRGLEKLITAVCQVPSEFKFEIRIYGGGRADYVSRLKSLSEDKSAAGRLIWMGPLGSAFVSDAYLDSHVGLVLYDSDDAGNDGLSNKLMECVSSGRPVLAGDLPQNRDFVSSNDVGWLCTMTVEGIAQGIRDVVSARAEFEDAAQRCRAIGDSWLTWDREFSAVADRLLSAT